MMNDWIQLTLPLDFDIINTNPAIERTAHGSTL